jgi:hypothetical protein
LEERWGHQGEHEQQHAQRDRNRPFPKVTLQLSRQTLWPATLEFKYVRASATPTWDE